MTEHRIILVRSQGVLFDLKNGNRVIVEGLTPGEKRLVVVDDETVIVEREKDMEDEEECCSCHSKGVPLKNYPAFRAEKEPRLLCWLCACTPAGNAQQYPEQFREQTAILETICFVGNEIIKTLQKGDYADET